MESPGATGISFLVHLDFAPHRGERHLIVIERAIQVGVGRNCRVGIGFAEKVNSDLGLGEEFVPEFHGEVVGYTGKDAQKVGLEVADGDLGCIPAVAAGWNQFVHHLVIVSYEGFHGVGDLVVKYMFAGDDTGVVEMRE